MASLSQLRDAAVESLELAFPALCVKPVSGSADAASILADYIGKGVVLVMALTAQNVAERNSLVFDLNANLAAIMVIHGLKNALSRENAGLPLAEGLALEIHGNTFGLSGVSPARVSAIAPIADEEITKRGLWAWTITWDQRLVLTP